MTVEDGMIVARGARYRALYLGGSSHRMTLRALAGSGRCWTRGRRSSASRPVCSPSLADDPAEHARLVRELWETGKHSGRLMDTEDLAAALGELGLVPSRTVAGAELVRIGRRIGEAELTFLANPGPEPVTATVRAATPLVSWNPVTVRREALPVITRPPTAATSIASIWHRWSPSCWSTATTSDFQNARPPRWPSCG